MRGEPCHRARATSYIAHRNAFRARISRAKQSQSSPKAVNDQYQRLADSQNGFRKGKVTTATWIAGIRCSRNYIKRIDHTRLKCLAATIVTCGTYKCAEERGRTSTGGRTTNGNDPTYPRATCREALSSWKVACSLILLLLHYKILPLIDVQYNIAANLRWAAEHPHLVNRP